MNTAYDTPSAVADQNQRSVDQTIRSGQQAAHRAVDRMADGFGYVAHSADRLAQRSAEALRENSGQLRERARHVADSTLGHIRQDPMKSVLIAGAIGAALALLLSMMGRSRD